MPNLDTTAPPTAGRRVMRRGAAIGSGVVLAGGTSSALLLTLLSGSSGAVGATLTVDSLADGTATGEHCVDGITGNCTLRDAIAKAVAGDTIEFASGLTGTITLTQGALSVTSGITITGPGASFVTVSGNNTSRVFTIGAVSSALTISGLTISGGATNSGSQQQRSGGGIYANAFTGAVTLSNLVVSSNVASSGLGGGIFLQGTGDVTVVDCTVTGNSAPGGRGGGVWFFGIPAGHTAMLRNSTIVNNSAVAAGGFYAQASGAVRINNSTIVGNSATNGKGGGVVNYGSTDFQINQSTIANNSATGRGGGVLLQQPSIVTGSIMSGNTSGSAGFADLATYGGGAMTAYVSNSLLQNPQGTITLSGSGNITGQDPLLSALASNGGPTQTMALGAGSPAIDAGPSPIGNFPGSAYDQRGIGYPRGNPADIGAFEFGVTPPTSSTTSTTTASTTTTTTTSGGGSTATTSPTATDPQSTVVPVFTG